MAARGRAVVAAGALSLMALGAVGQIARDRNVPLALMMYIPLLPVGLCAVAVDLLARGRCVPRVRFGLAIAGAAAAVWGGALMTGGSSPEPAPPGSTEISLLHWNVMWGGHDPSQWRETAAKIVLRNPDLVVLSEAPSDDRVADALSQSGPRWNVVYITNPPKTGYWYNPMVCSRGPLKIERRVDIRNGAAMSVLAGVKGRTVRLLVVDGKSDPRILRTPMLHDIAAACDEAARRDEPIDLVVGDFNSMGRSIGFDALTVAGGGGYRRAAPVSGGWRATWPAPVPLYDIDHVWLRSSLAGPRIVGCELFSSRRTDHRGQFVRLAFPPER
jgi:endonuclease/exonuclease/phosphatase (EEP) superfamily protein YafD